MEGNHHKRNKGLICGDSEKVFIDKKHYKSHPAQPHPQTKNKGTQWSDGRATAPTSSISPPEIKQQPKYSEKELPCLQTKHKKFPIDTITIHVFLFTTEIYLYERWAMINVKGRLTRLHIHPVNLPISSEEPLQVRLASIILKVTAENWPHFSSNKQRPSF